MSNSQPTILYVDDDVDARRSFTRTFKAKFNILTASDAFEGFSVLERNAEKIGVVVSDQRMPGQYGTGVQFLSRCHSYYPRVVRVLVSAHKDFDAVIKAINLAQVYKYANKPWETEEMETLLETALAKHITQREQPLEVATPVSISAAGEVDAIPSSLAQLPYKTAKRLLLDSFEERYMKQALLLNNGNISRAARASGIHRKTIHRFKNRIDEEK